MPTSPHSRCAEPGCTELVERGRCATHKPVPHGPTEVRTRYRGNDWWGQGSTHRWRKVRAVQLAHHPNCAHCGSLAEVVDHIIPRSLGGAMYDPANHQSLCVPCHDVKSAHEKGATLAASRPRTYHVDNRVIVVSGPPCSGKTDYVASRRQAYDLVLDMHALAVALGAPGHARPPHLVPFLCELRDAFLARLTRRHQAPRVWIITGEPRMADRLVGAQHVRMPTTRDECISRAAGSGRPECVELIDAWFTEHGAYFPPFPK